MMRPPIDLLLERMFLARRVVLRAGAVFVVWLIAGLFAHWAGLLTERGELVLVVAPLFIVLLLILGGSLVTCYYVFAPACTGWAAGTLSATWCYVLRFPACCFLGSCSFR